MATRLEQDIVNGVANCDLQLYQLYQNSTSLPNLVNLVHKWRKWDRSFDPPKINFYRRSYLRG